MRQIFNGKTPEDKPVKAKNGDESKFANKAIVISKPKDVLVGKAGQTLEAEVTFLNASK